VHLSYVTICHNLDCTVIVVPRAYT
jgi:hypothetical protein